MNGNPVKSQANAVNGHDSKKEGTPITTPAEWKNVVKVQVNGQERDCVVIINTISGNLARLT